MLSRCFPSDPMILSIQNIGMFLATNGNKSLTRGPKHFNLIVQSDNNGLRSFVEDMKMLILKMYVWKGKSD